MPVPTSLLGDLRQTPADRPVTLLMRHSVRFPIYDFATGDAIGLTPEGFLLAEQFGTVLGTLRRPGRLLSSPVGRCVDTARSILKGAGWTDPLEIDPLLGHPYMEPAWQLLDSHTPGQPIPQTVFDLLELATRNHHIEPVIDVLVTHDSVLGSLIGYLLGLPVHGPEYWPGFLEGIYFWKEPAGTVMVWRGQRFVRDGSLLPAH